MWFTELYPSPFYRQDPFDRVESFLSSLWSENIKRSPGMPLVLGWRISLGQGWLKHFWNDALILCEYSVVRFCIRKIANLRKCLGILGELVPEWFLFPVGVWNILPFPVSYFTISLLSAVTLTLNPFIIVGRKNRHHFCPVNQLWVSEDNYIYDLPRSQLKVSSKSELVSFAHYPLILIGQAIGADVSVSCSSNSATDSSSFGALN